MCEKDKIRKIIPTHQDKIYSKMTGTNVRLKTSISEREIEEFCRGCEFVNTSLLSNAKALEKFFVTTV